jgi:hypothetical protein
LGGYFFYTRSTQAAPLLTRNGAFRIGTAAIALLSPAVARFDF